MSLDDGVVNENHLDDELRSQPLHDDLVDGSYENDGMKEL